MAEVNILTRVKGAIGITGTDFDDELSSLIEAAQTEMTMLGIDTTSRDELIVRTIICYVRAYFGIEMTDENERWMKVYKENIARLRMADDYTDWRR